MKIALLPGGFKPPHLGHYNMAKYLANFADDVIVRIGRKERDGIGPELALEIFNYYKAADPDSRAQKLTISIASHPSPVKDVYDFVEQIAPEGSELILGMGEKDAQDGRYNSIPKFAEPRNIKSEIKLVPPQAGGISGTRMREIIKSNDKEEFFKYIPKFLPEEIKEEIWTKLQDTTMPSDINEGITDYIPTLNKIKDLSKSLYSTKHLPQGPPENRTPEEEKEYRDILDNKRDAFRHILASAYFSTKLGNTITKGAGEFVEFIGALKNKLKGGAFDSGWAMDTANNKIGLELGKKNPNASLDEFTSLVQNIIDKGEFYASDGNTLHKNLKEHITFKSDISLGDIEFLDAQADADIEENTPLPGKSSAKGKEFKSEAKPEIKELTVLELLQTVKGIPYYKEVVDDLKRGDESWEVTKKVKEYAEYMKKNPNSLKNLPPINIIDGKLDDGAHRISAIYLLQNFLDPNNLFWKTVKLKTAFYTASDIKEMMGGTMNKQEMAKHLANMKKLRKFFSKQGDQMTQIPTNLTKGLRRKLYEGRYDEEVLRQSRFVINKFKEEFGKKFTGESDKSYIGWLKGTPTQRKNSDEYQLNYKLDLEFIPDRGLKLMSFDIYANAGPNGIYIKIIYNPDAFPQAYNKLTYEVKDALRHELEHVGQYEFDKDAYPEGEELEGFEYFTAEEEIPAFVQGLYKQAKTRKLPLSQVFDEFLVDRSAELSDKEEELVKLIWTDYAKRNLPAAQFENFLPYKANQVQQVRYKASDTFTNDRKKAKKLGYLEEAGIDKAELIKGMEVEKEHTNDPRIALKIALDHLAEDPKYYTKLATLGLKEMKLFSKEWWSNLITEELLNEGGAAGHMAHPFDLPQVKTGKDLIKLFEQAADSLKKTPGSVKIDGVNASIRLVNFNGKREFAMDRGSKKALDLKGVTKADLEARFGAGHGMIKSGGDVLDIFNSAMNTIQPELERLGLWEDPNIMFNMEYVSGKSNVQDYGKNFLAIHGLLEVETKETEGARGTLVKRVTSEKNFAQSDMDVLLKKLEPFAKKKGFEIYGSVPTKFTKDPDFKSVLNTRYTIDTAEGDQTKTLGQWLDRVNNIPKTDRLKMNVDGAVKDVGALSKQVYFAVFGGENVDDLFNNEQEIQKAIQGATTYLATEKLGDAILDVLDSPMGSVNDHEGVVIRDEKISPRPFKITGKFITGGVSSQFQQK